MTSRRPRKPQRRGMVAVEAVMTIAVFVLMSVQLLKLAILACDLLHHTCATLVGWPIL